MPIDGMMNLIISHINKSAAPKKCIPEMCILLLGLLSSSHAQPSLYSTCHISRTHIIPMQGMGRGEGDSHQSD